MDKEIIGDKTYLEMCKDDIVAEAVKWYKAKNAKPTVERNDKLEEVVGDYLRALKR